MSVKLINGERVERDLEKLAKRAGFMARDLADVAARVGIKSLIRNTQPFGLGGKARKMGEAAVARDVSRVFSSPTPGVRPEIVSLDGAREHHRAVWSPGKKVSRNARRKTIDIGIFRVFMAEELAKVGKAKGAWAAGLERLGVKGIQKWIQRHADEGRAVRQGRDGNVTWAVHAMPKHVADSYVLGERGAYRAMSNQERNIKKFFESKIKAEMKKAERKLNS